MYLIFFITIIQERFKNIDRQKSCIYYNLVKLKSVVFLVPFNKIYTLRSMMNFYVYKYNDFLKHYKVFKKENASPDEWVYGWKLFVEGSQHLFSTQI